MKLTFRLKGGAGSGFHGHAGIPDHQGGSLPDGEQKIDKNRNLAAGTKPISMHDIYGFDKVPRNSAKSAEEFVKKYNMETGDRFYDQNGKGHYFLGLHGEWLLNMDTKPTMRDVENPNLSGAVHFSDAKFGRKRNYDL